MQWAVESFSFDYFVRLGDDSYFRPDEFYRQVLTFSFSATSGLTAPLQWGGMPVINPGRGNLTLHSITSGCGCCMQRLVGVAVHVRRCRVSFPPAWRSLGTSSARTASIWAWATTR